MAMDDEVPFCLVAVAEDLIRGRGETGPGTVTRTPISAPDRIVEALCAAMFAPDAVLHFAGAKAPHRVTLEAVTAGPRATRVLRCKPPSSASRTSPGSIVSRRRCSPGTPSPCPVRGRWPASGAAGGTLRGPACPAERPTPESACR